MRPNFGVSDTTEDFEYHARQVHKKTVRDREKFEFHQKHAAPCFSGRGAQTQQSRSFSELRILVISILLFVRHSHAV